MLSATVHDVLYYMSPIYCQDIINSVLWIICFNSSVMCMHIFLLNVDYKTVAALCLFSLPDSFCFSWSIFSWQIFFNSLWLLRHEMFGYHSKIRAVEAIWHGGDTSFCIHTSDLSTLILIRIQHRFALAIGDLPSHQKKKTCFSSCFVSKT